MKSAVSLRFSALEVESVRFLVVLVAFGLARQILPCSREGILPLGFRRESLQKGQQTLSTLTGCSIGQYSHWKHDLHQSRRRSFL